MYFSPNNLVSISNFYDAQAQAGSVQCMHFCFPQSEMSTNKVRVSVRCPQQGPDCPELCPASVQILSGVSRFRSEDNGDNSAVALQEAAAAVSPG